MDGLSSSSVPREFQDVASSSCFFVLSTRIKHRRRMKREAKTKVVPSVWGAECIQFLAAQAVLPRSIWKKRLNSSYSSKLTDAKWLARQGIILNWDCFLFRGKRTEHFLYKLLIRQARTTCNTTE